MLTKEKKEKLKRLLVALSSEDEKDKLGQREMLVGLANSIDEITNKTEVKLDTIEQRYDELVNVLERNKNTTTKHNGLILQSVNDFSEALNKKLDEIKEIQKIPKGDVFGPNKAEDSNLVAFDGSGKKIKDSGLATSKIKTAIEKIGKLEKSSGRKFSLYGGGIVGVGVNKITVSDTAPSNPSINDLWVDIS